MGRPRHQEHDGRIHRFSDAEGAGADRPDPRQGRARLRRRRARLSRRQFGALERGLRLRPRGHDRGDGRTDPALPVLPCLLRPGRRYGGGAVGKAGRSVAVRNGPGFLHQLRVRGQRHDGQDALDDEPGGGDAGAAQDHHPDQFLSRRHGGLRVDDRQTL